MKLIKFNAIWCVECIVSRPLWEDIVAEFPGLDLVQYDADEDPEILERYGVKDIPILIFEDKEGNELERIKGVNDKKRILAMIEQYKKS